MACFRVSSSFAGALKQNGAPIWFVNPDLVSAIRFIEDVEELDSRLRTSTRVGRGCWLAHLGTCMYKYLIEVRASRLVSRLAESSRDRGGPVYQNTVGE